MAPKKNPLNLNALQLKTLTLLQAAAQRDGRAANGDGEILVDDLPQPHGDHFHLGQAVVLTRDATGLTNPAAWAVLERKGLIKSMFPHAAILTATGLAYDTGLAQIILHHADH